MTIQGFGRAVKYLLCGFSIHSTHPLPHGDLYWTTLYTTQVCCITDFMRLESVGDARMGFLVEADAIDEVGGFVGKGVVRYITTVGQDGRGGDPIGLTGKLGLGPDLVILDGAMGAHEVDIENIGLRTFDA